MRERKDTRIHLVAELEQYNKPFVLGQPLIAEIIAEAKAGEYHDYKNKKYICGKVELVDKLRKVGLDSLAQRVIAGEFDEAADEEDKAMMRQELPKNLWPTFGLEETN